MKTCTKCGVTKDEGEFHKKLAGLTSACKTCISASGRRYREQNREKVLEGPRRWRAQNREYISECNRLYREQNREALNEYARRWREQNAETLREFDRLRRAEDPDRCRGNERRRRARAYNAPGEYTEIEVRDLYRKQKGLCGICSTFVPYAHIHRDHKTPLARGGSNDISNIEILCASCNLKKHTKTRHEFARYFHRTEGIKAPLI